MRLCYSGPPNQHTQRWVQAFARRGHEVHLILDEPNDYKGVNVYSLDLVQTKNITYFLKKLARLRRLVADLKPDILHTHYLTGEGYVGALSGFHPFVVTIWGTDIYLRPHNGWDERWFTTFTLKQADYVTADSQDQIEAAVRFGADRANASVIQWGVDRETFNPGQREAIRARLGFGDDPVVISQRKCLPLYNIDVIVHAFRDVLKTVPNAHLLITGGGDHADDIEAVQTIQRLVDRTGIGDRVYFTGYIPYQELPAYIAAADVTVSVPSEDGTAMSLLEGMACGAAPVVSDLASNREWIKDGGNGFLVPVRDIATLADRILQLLRNPEKRNLFADHNQRMIADRADHSANMDKMEQVYERLIAKAVPRSRSVAPHKTSLLQKVRPLLHPKQLFRLGVATLADHTPLPPHGLHDHENHLREAAQWLGRAQAVHGDGGCAKCYNLLENRWEPSYPETSGYIIPTFLALAAYYADERYTRHARGVGDWLLTLQLESGAFPWLDHRTPVVFDTGQILHGLLSLWGAMKDHRYLSAAEKAATWLASVQETDGTWVQHEFRQKPHTYNTLVSGAMARAWSVTDRLDFRVSAIRQLDWALTQQRTNGWFAQNSLDDGVARPILHTIVYAAQGLLESGILLQEERYTEAARVTAQALAESYQTEGRLYGAYDENWRGATKSRCLTGEAQLAGLWLRLDAIDRTESHEEMAYRLNADVKRTQNIATFNLGVRGGIQGSYPIYGSYMTYRYPNWAAKYFIDALLLESQRRNDNNSPV